MNFKATVLKCCEFMIQESVLNVSAERMKWIRLSDQHHNLGRVCRRK